MISDWRDVYREERRRPGYVIDNGRPPVRLSNKSRPTEGPGACGSFLKGGPGRVRRRHIPGSHRVWKGVSSGFQGVSTDWSRTNRDPARTIP